MKLPDGMRILLVMYDMQSAFHSTLRSMLTNWFGKEGGRWIRVQRSVVLIYTELTPQEFYEIFTVDVTSWEEPIDQDPPHVYVTDVSLSSYAGFGFQKVWNWLATLRPARNQDRRRLTQRRDRKRGFQAFIDEKLSEEEWDHFESTWRRWTRRELTDEGWNAFLSEWDLESAEKSPGSG